MTAVMFPLGLLLWIQIRFLPFHSPFDTWLHRIAVIVDTGLILFILLPRLWPRLRALAGAPGWQTPFRQAVSVPVFIVLACVATVFVSLFVATIPDRPGGVSWFAKNMELRERVLTANVLTPEDINALRDATQPEQVREVLAKVMPFQALQGRDFRYADLYNAVLPRLDLRAVRTDDAVAGEPLPADCGGAAEIPPRRGLQRAADAPLRLLVGAIRRGDPGRRQSRLGDSRMVAEPRAPEPRDLASGLHETRIREALART
jgi:hypothetical protein